MPRPIFIRASISTSYHKTYLYRARNAWLARLRLLKMEAIIFFSLHNTEISLYYFTLNNIEFFEL